jgi:hypothetical protein
MAGALIAIPALTGPFQKILQSPLFGWTFIGWTFVFFVLGLTSVIAAGIVAFFALARRSDESLELSTRNDVMQVERHLRHVSTSEADRGWLADCIGRLPGVRQRDKRLHHQHHAASLAYGAPSGRSGIAPPRLTSSSPESLSASAAKREQADRSAEDSRNPSSRSIAFCCHKFPAVAS